MQILLVCVNCRKPFAHKAPTQIELDMAKQLGASWCCDTCCTLANNYFESDEYKAFEKSEVNQNGYSQT